MLHLDIRHYPRIRQLHDHIQHLDYLDISVRMDNIDNEHHMNRMVREWFYYRSDLIDNRDYSHKVLHNHHLKKEKSYRKSLRTCSRLTTSSSFIVVLKLCLTLTLSRAILHTRTNHISLTIGISCA